MVKVAVEYCGAWGYAPRYEDLARQIKAKVPQADVTGFVGRQTCFEVSVDDTVVHSKLSTMSFPDYDEVAEIVAEVANGEPIRQVTKTESAGCTIL